MTEIQSNITELLPWYFELLFSINSCNLCYINFIISSREAYDNGVRKERKGNKILMESPLCLWFLLLKNQCIFHIRFLLLYFTCINTWSFPHLIMIITMCCIKLHTFIKQVQYKNPPLKIITRKYILGNSSWKAFTIDV